MNEHSEETLRLLASLDQAVPESEIQREIDLAWAAGLFEGEGSVGISTPGKKNKRSYVILQLQSTDRDTVMKFNGVVRIGTVGGPYVHGGPRKPTWRWQASGVPAIGLITDPLFLRHLCLRRTARLKQILLLMRYQGPGPGARLPGRCTKGHSFDEENTGWKSDGDRYCLKCSRRRAREQNERKRARKLR